MSRRVHFMNWSRTTALSVAAIVCLTMAGDACAELIPTPNFSDHDIPSTRVVEAPSVVWNAVDVGVLLVALSLASYFALVVRSRKYLLWLSVASLLWFGFWRRGCVCPIGATQNVTLATFDGTYVVPISVVAFFVLPLIFTVFFGRTFCASVCPLGAVQELVSVRNVRVPRWLDQALSVIPYVYLGLAVTLAATGKTFAEVADERLENENADL